MMQVSKRAYQTICMVYVTAGSLSQKGTCRTQLWQLCRLDFLCEAEHFENPDAVPVHVNFVPLQAVTRGSRMSVVVVMPTFAES